MSNNETNNDNRFIHLHTGLKKTTESWGEGFPVFLFYYGFHYSHTKNGNVQANVITLNCYDL